MQKSWPRKLQGLRILGCYLFVCIWLMVVGRQVGYFIDYCPFKSSYNSSLCTRSRKSRTSRSSSDAYSRETNVLSLLFQFLLSDPILAMAVVNALGPLVKTRHTLSSKIISAFLAVDIVSIPQTAQNPTKAQLQLRSVSKTIRIQLSHFLKYRNIQPY